MPDTKFGKCPWCERERLLFFVIGSHDKNIWCGYICHDCLEHARNGNDETINSKEVTEWKEVD